MPAFNIYLGEIGNPGLDQAAKDHIQESLTNWFGQIVQETNYTASVSWVRSEPTMQNYELLIYFVEGIASSVARYLPGGSYAPGTNNPRGGHTEWAGDGLTVSEVYVNRCSNNVAEMTFHELMHNKLHLDDSLHSRDGLARSPVPTGSPSPGNIEQMRAALSNNHAQWAGGWSLPFAHSTMPAGFAP